MTASIQIKGEKYYVVLSWLCSGKRKQKWINTNLSANGNNKRKAEKQRLELLKEWEDVVITDDANDILFSNYIKEWLEESRTSIEETTYFGYKSVIEGVICPYFEERKIKLAELKPEHISEFYAEKMANDAVSANTIHHYHANIHNSLKHAVLHKKIKTNPADYVLLPKKTKHIASYYKVNEMQQLIRASEGSAIEPVVRIAVWFGLRRGEIIGLKWDYINFVDKTISVRGTVIKAGTLRYKESAKTDASIRTLPMHDEAAQYFSKLREKQEANKKRFGSKYNMQWDGFVCVHDDGRLLTLDYATRSIPDMCEQHGLKKIHLHELRHSNISLLVGSGISMKKVQVWAGHNYYATTADIYSHIQTQNSIELSETVHNLLSENISLESR